MTTRPLTKESAYQVNKHMKMCPTWRITKKMHLNHMTHQHNMNSKSLEQQKSPLLLVGAQKCTTILEN